VMFHVFFFFVSTRLNCVAQCSKGRVFTPISRLLSTVGNILAMYKIRGFFYGESLKKKSEADNGKISKRNCVTESRLKCCLRAR
jgi:hypothetical protein